MEWRADAARSAPAADGRAGEHAPVAAQVERERVQRERDRADHRENADDAVEDRERAARVGPSQLVLAASVAAKNQKYAAPTQIDWNAVFHLAGPIAAITTPRRAAAWRKSVMNASRPSTIASTHHGQRDVADRRAEREHVAPATRATNRSSACDRWTHEHVHRDERAEQQQLVGERIEQPPEIRLLLARAGEMPST